MNIDNYSDIKNFIEKHGIKLDITDSHVHINFSNGSRTITINPYRSDDELAERIRHSLVLPPNTLVLDEIVVNHLSILSLAKEKLFYFVEMIKNDIKGITNTDLLLEAIEDKVRTLKNCV